MSTLNVQYIAGLFDGEGWVRADTFTPLFRKSTRFQVTAGIAMTYEPVIRLLYERYGGVLQGDDCFRRKNPANRTIWRWSVSSRIAAPFLREIEPFVIVKREQVTLALELQDHIREYRSRMVGDKVSAEFKAEICAHRQKIADELRRLKKVNYNLQITSDPTAGIQAASAKVPFSAYSSS